MRSQVAAALRQDLRKYRGEPLLPWLGARVLVAGVAVHLRPTLAYPGWL